MVGDSERFEGLLAAISDLVEANEEATILVEGRRDVESLQALGCRGTVIAVNRGEPLFHVCEQVAAGARDVILLTDWDRRGHILLSQVLTGLTANGCRVDTAFRERIRGYVGGDLKDVEGLAGYVSRGLQRHRRVSLAEHLATVHDHLDALQGV